MRGRGTACCTSASWCGQQSPPHDPRRGPISNFSGWQRAVFHAISTQRYEPRSVNDMFSTRYSLRWGIDARFGEHLHGTCEALTGIKAAVHFLVLHMDTKPSLTLFVLHKNVPKRQVWM